jgi:hypothetical protein
VAAGDVYAKALAQHLGDQHLTAVAQLHAPAREPDPSA